MKFRFTIRDLLWLTVVVAVLVAWWVDHRRLAIKILVNDAIAKDDGLLQYRKAIEQLKAVASGSSPNDRTTKYLQSQISQLENRLKSREDELRQSITKQLLGEFRLWPDIPSRTPATF